MMSTRQEQKRVEPKYGQEQRLLKILNTTKIKAEADTTAIENYIIIIQKDISQWNGSRDIISVTATK